MLRCLIGLLVLSFLATAQQITAPTATTHVTYNISGTVVNDATGQPLPRITVATGPAQKPGTQTTISDEQGHFNFTGLAQGKYWLGAQGRGFPRQLLDEHEFFSTAIAVGEGMSSDGVVFRLHPGAVITGVVTDDLNEPVRNAQVMLFHDQLENGKREINIQERAQTDDRGQYHFSHLAAGTYFVGVTAQPWYAQHREISVSRMIYDVNGKQIVQNATVEATPLDVTFPLTFFEETTDSNSATPLLLKPGDRAIADVRLTAVPAMQLTVHQPNTSDYPNTSLTQKVFGNFSLPVQVLNTSNHDGELKMTGLPPGQYTLNVQTNGANPSGDTQEVSLDQSGEVSFTKITPAITVHGIVTLEGAPVPKHAFVQLRSKDSEEVHGSQVSDKGEFEIKEPVRPGSYDVRVFYVQGAVVGSITRQGSPTSDANTLDLTGSGPVQIEIKMVHGLGHIDGVVLKDGKPFAGAMVLLVPDDFAHHGWQIRRDQSDSDGTFSLSAALPGEYRVVAIQNGWNLKWNDPNVLTPYLHNSEPLQVVANQKYKVKVPLQ